MSALSPESCLFQSIWKAPYGASIGWLRRDRIEDIGKVIPPLAIPPWRWVSRTQFHARGGAFMCVMADQGAGGDDGGSVWIWAKTQEPLLFLRSYAGIAWDYAAF